MTADKILQNLKAIEIIMAIRISPDDPHGVMDKISKLTDVMGLSAECHANAEHLYNVKLGEIYQSDKYENYSAMDKKNISQGLLANETRLMTLAEGYSKKMDKMIEGLRTIVSYAKNEQKQYG